MFSVSHMNTYSSQSTQNNGHTHTYTLSLHISTFMYILRKRKVLFNIN